MSTAHEALLMAAQVLGDVADGATGGALQSAALTAMDACHAAIKASAWQPIETAPKDGTKFLGCRRGEVATSYRVQRDDCEMWTFAGTSADHAHWPLNRPSHWMPHPAPPEAA